jgi:hypothetical protein
MGQGLKTPSAELPEGKPLELGPGLRLIRRRRWYLWAVILIYLPLMWTTLQFTAVFNATALAFAVWFVFLLVIALLAAVARCPRCGNYFHVNGMTFLCLRKCLHCQLHLTADRQRKGNA